MTAVGVGKRGTRYAAHIDGDQIPDLRVLEVFNPGIPVKVLKTKSIRLRETKDVAQLMKHRCVQIDPGDVGPSKSGERVGLARKLAVILNAVIDPVRCPGVVEAYSTGRRLAVVLLGHSPAGNRCQ